MLSRRGHPFLITGLPRSRTAWLSVAASDIDSICYHEPVERMASWQGAQAIWSRSQHYWTGISDSMLGLHLVDLLMWVAPRTLVVERPKEDVAASLRNRFPDWPETNYVDILADRLALAKGHPLVRTVDYADLADPRIVKACLEWLMPAKAFSVERLAELGRMHIENDMRHLKRIGEPDIGMLGRYLGEDVVALLAPKAV